jgi:DNA polymerase sigma
MDKEKLLQGFSEWLRKRNRSGEDIEKYVGKLLDEVFYYFDKELDYKDVVIDRLEESAGISWR